jgi:hypothetical protein
MDTPKYIRRIGTSTSGDFGRPYTPSAGTGFETIDSE